MSILWPPKACESCVLARDGQDWGAYEYEVSPLPNGTPWGNPIAGFPEITSLPDVVGIGPAQIDVDSWLTRLPFPRKGFRGYSVEGTRNTIGPLDARDCGISAYTSAQWPSPGQMAAWGAAQAPYSGPVQGLVSDNTRGRKSCTTVSNQPAYRWDPVPPYWYADQRGPQWGHDGTYTHTMLPEDLSRADWLRCHV